MFPIGLSLTHAVSRMARVLGGAVMLILTLGTSVPHLGNMTEAYSLSLLHQAVYGGLPWACETTKYLGNIF